MVDDVTDSKVETEEEIGDPLEAETAVKKLMMELELAEKPEKHWRKEVDTIIDVYRSESKTEANFAQSENTMNILWSNTETLKAAMYDRAPKPDVRRRWRTADEGGKDIATALERGLSFSLDQHDFDLQIEMANEDYLLGGRGTVRVKYTPHFETVMVEPQTDPETGEVIEVGGEQEQKVYEEVSIAYVHWDDFRLSPAKSWGDVNKIYFRGKMTRSELIDAFGEELGNKVTLDWSPHSEEERSKDENTSVFKRAVIWECWDKDIKKVTFFAPSFKESILLEKDDPLSLEHFYPTPRPMYSIRTSGSMVPIPEYRLYENQAKELDTITKRITTLTDSLKVRGSYNGNVTELGRILDMGDNDLVPVEDWPTFSSTGGLEGALSFVPLEPIIQALRHLYEAREQVKATIYEITGISDIVRGQTMASETATAQRIKGQFASLRIDKRKAEIARFIRDLYRMMGEIIAEQFSPETLQMITGVEITPELVEVLQSDAQRAYRVDIETQMTVLDEAGERDAATNLLKGVVEYINGISPAVQSGGIPEEVAKELLLSVIRKHKVGRDMEDALTAIGQQEGEGEDQLQQLKQQAEQQIQQMQQQMQQMQEQMQSGQMEAQAQAQADAQADVAKEQGKLQAQAQADQFKAQAAAQGQQVDGQFKMTIEQQKIDFQREVKDAELALDWQKFEAELNLKREQLGLERQKAEFDAELKVSAENRTQMQCEMDMMNPPKEEKHEEKSEEPKSSHKEIHFVRDENDKIMSATVGDLDDGDEYEAEKDL